MRAAERIASGTSRSAKGLTAFVLASAVGPLRPAAIDTRIVVRELETDIDRQPSTGILRRRGVPKRSFVPWFDRAGAIDGAHASAGRPENAITSVRPNPAELKTA